MLAIVLGIWIVVSIVVTPLIGYFLFALRDRQGIAKRSSPAKRLRPTNWGHLNAHRHLYSHRTKPAERRAVRGHRAG